jgi:hypothetical protein
VPSIETIQAWAWRALAAAALIALVAAADELGRRAHAAMLARIIRWRSR